MTHSTHFSSAHLASGSIFANKYRLRRQLGEGGMGSVWEAEHLLLGTTVALKMVEPSLAKSSEVISRFSREAQATAALRCEQVVQVFDHDVFQGQPYLVLERLKGETLAERLARVRRLDVEQTLRVLTPIAQAADLARRAGIVHRDLKPSNVFLTYDARSSRQDFRVKVFDFGVAKLQAGFAQAECKTWGTVVGTPWYMSPEQARGLASVDHTTDLWAIAVMAYESLSGKPPFDHATMRGLLDQICAAKRPSLAASFPFADAFNRWFEKATASDPAQRFQSGHALIESLTNALTPSASQPLPFQAIQSHPEATDEESSSVRRRYATTLPTAVEVARPSGRHRGSIAWAAAGILFCVGAVSTWGVHTGSAQVDRASSAAGADVSQVNAIRDTAATAERIDVRPQSSLRLPGAVQNSIGQTETLATAGPATTAPVTLAPVMAAHLVATESNVESDDPAALLASLSTLSREKRTVERFKQPTAGSTPAAAGHFADAQQATGDEPRTFARVVVGDGRSVALPSGGLNADSATSPRPGKSAASVSVPRAWKVAAAGKEIDLGI